MSAVRHVFAAGPCPHPDCGGQGRGVVSGWQCADCGHYFPRSRVAIGSDDEPRCRRGMGCHAPCWHCGRADGHRPGCQLWTPPKAPRGWKRLRPARCPGCGNFAGPASATGGDYVLLHRPGCPDAPGQTSRNPLLVDRDELDLSGIRAHCHEHHGETPHRDNLDLAAWHARQHRRYLSATGHIHRGPFVLVRDQRGRTIGAVPRPRGWYTGEEAVTRTQLRAEWLAQRG